MALSNKAYTYDKLGEINTNGIEVAIFPEIRDAIADRMREIYGNDIDLSTASADGQYVNMEALIVNNIYKLVTNLYENLNPFTASGKYLDILCSLTNIARKTSSNSTANVYVKNVSNINQTPDSIDLIDRNGVIWTWTNPTALDGITKLVTIPTGVVTELPFICEVAGPIEATAGPAVVSPSTDIDWNSPNLTDNNGDIYKPIDFGIFKVYQATDAILGNDIETDTSLRSRRFSYLGANSVTTQAGLEASLYSLDGIEDVYILNNNTGSDITANDGVEVKNHNVYVVLRYKEGLDIDPSIISDIIYNKLTPGVNTQAFDSDHGTGGENVQDTIQLFSRVNTILYWKKCIPVKPQIIINFKLINNYFVQGSSGDFSNYEQAIVTQLKNYLNNIKINDQLLSSSIQTIMIGADLKYQGLSTFYPTACTIDSNTTFLAPLTYYSYDDSDFVFDYETDPDNPTLTIG